MLDARLYWLLDRKRAKAIYWNASIGRMREIPDSYDALPMGLGKLALSTQSPKFTASLDAALALASRVLPGWEWTTAAPSKSRKVPDKFFARLASPDFDCVTWEAGDKWTTDVLAGTDAHAYASTPALALCIAILKATQSRSTPEDGEG